MLSSVQMELNEYNIHGIGHERAYRKDNIFHFHAKMTIEKLYIYMGERDQNSRVIAKDGTI